MTIICGTDFSPAAVRAANVAAQWAAKTSQSLVVVHAGRSDDAQSRLDALVATLSERFGINADGIARSGAPHDALIEETNGRAASLIIAGATGEREGAEHVFGSTAERLSRESRVPVLLVRDERPLSEWLAASGSLDVTIATDFTPASDAALLWARELTQVAPCEFVLLYVSWPPEDRRRFGIEGPMDLDRTDERLRAALERELEAVAARVNLDASTWIESSFGRASDALITLADRRHTGLLVVGRHDEARWAQLFGSHLSERAAHGAHTNIACVPTRSVE